MIFDTHIHLNDEKLINNLDKYIAEAKEKNITKFLCVGWDIESSKKAIEIANKYDGVFAAISVMPTSYKSYNDNSLNELRKLAENKKVVCIGETGLDYYWENSDEVKEIQKKMFIEHIKLANELDLPISIHCRDAYKDTLDILTEHPVNRKSIMHCYSGSYEISKEFLKRNLVLAFGGSLTFKNNKNGVETIKKTDIKNIVFETDAPYLAPTPYRGQLNEPKFIFDVVKFASEVLEYDFEELSNITFKTSTEIFSRE